MIFYWKRDSIKPPFPNCEVPLITATTNKVQKSPFSLFIVQNRWWWSKSAVYMREQKKTTDIYELPNSIWNFLITTGFNVPFFSFSWNLRMMEILCNIDLYEDKFVITNKNTLTVRFKRINYFIIKCKYLKDVHYFFINIFNISNK